MTTPMPDQPPMSPETQAAAQISPDDVARAKVAWERDAPPEFRHLLDAEPQGEG
jgi:hypothetical protein